MHRTDGLPKYRGRIHEAAFFVSIPLGLALVAAGRGAAARVSALVFAASLAGVFGVSAAYHRGRWTEAARLRMKRLDHSMIFVLIAGSYTPFCLLVIRGWWGGSLLAIVWAGALAGIVLKLVSIDRLHVVSGILYMSLGWAAILALPRLVNELSPLQLALVVGGGVLYTLGAVVLLCRRPDPSPAFGYHEVWHAMGVAAGALHYVAILLVVTAVR
ncbi:MAG TPA: hemolysin III family protein [Actinomycetota bacterium]|nr:hemolysin III family protein [Actinomycetota bacterium]